MTESQENPQVNRLVALSRQLDDRIWSKGSFPAEERPDLGSLLPNLTIDSNPPLASTPHPVITQLKNTPVWNKLVSSGLAQSAQKSSIESQKKIAEYDPYTRQISVNPIVLSRSDEELKRILAHEIATDNYGQSQNFSYEEVPNEIKKKVDIFMAQFAQLGIQLDGQVQISQTGASQYLLVDGHAVGSMSPPITQSYDEIYPTIFELVTSEIDKRGGDMRRFEKDIRQRRLRVDPDEQHINFTTTLFRAMELVDWRVLLHAFKQRDVRASAEIIQAQSTLYGSGIFTELVKQMDRDENIISGIVKNLIQQGYNIKRKI